ncbi:histamine H2 receptor-like [Montipora foliosa]|uniref:histamine H2 receptor-like n=1 Tax=Montipora foliosa TaxID=591990 RepID=UPI0035F1C132
MQESQNSFSFNTSFSGSSNQTFPEPLKRFLSSPYIALLGILCLLIFGSNGLVIYLICKKRTLRSITNMFLTSLALSDLISGVVGFPLLAICSLKEFIHICVSSVMFIRFSAIASVCHVLLIAVDRYIAIVHPLQRATLVTKRRAIFTTVFVWILSFTASFIQMTWYFPENTVLDEYEDKTENIDVKYSKACIVFFFAVPLVLMCFIYGRIFYISCKHTESDRRLSVSLQQAAPRFLRPNEWRGKSVLLILVVIFIGCWLPFFWAMLGDHKESSQFSPMPLWVERLMIFLRFLPPLSNPLLCTLWKQDFRSALRTEVFQKIIRNT